MEVKKPYVFSKTRFEFELKINDNIICQRYVNIENFNKDSIYSYELHNSIKEICQMIDNDLISKSRVFCDMKCSNGYKNEEFIPKPKEDTINHPLTFTFKVDGKPVISRMWSGDNYPIAIRNNIDITNKKKFTNVDELRLYHDNKNIKYIYNDRESLIPKITSILQYDCSEKEYTTGYTIKGEEIYSFKRKNNL